MQHGYLKPERTRRGYENARDVANVLERIHHRYEDNLADSSVTKSVFESILKKHFGDITVIEFVIFDSNKLSHILNDLENDCERCHEEIGHFELSCAQHALSSIMFMNQC